MYTIVFTKRRKDEKGVEFYLKKVKEYNYFPSAAFLASLFNFRFSQIVPPIQ